MVQCPAGKLAGVFMRGLLLAAAALAMTLLLLTVYVASYVALLTPTPRTLSEKGHYWFRQPRYRFGGERAECLFSPLNHFDQTRARPEYWYELTESGKRWAG